MFERPTVTALGIGPVDRDEVPELRRLQVYRKSRPDLGLSRDLAALVALAYAGDADGRADKAVAYASDGDGGLDERKVREVLAAFARQLAAERAQS